MKICSIVFIIDKHLDPHGIHANCERFQINDRTGSKLVAIDSSQIQVYTDDLAIVTGTRNKYSSRLLFSS
jgi:hypothetical protein